MYACQAGTGSLVRAGSPTNCSPCAKGYYATGDGTGCVKCPSGKTTSNIGAKSLSECK